MQYKLLKTLISMQSGDCAVVHHMALGKPVYVLRQQLQPTNKARMMADKLAGKDTYMSGFLGSSCLKVLDYELACTGVNELLRKNITSRCESTTNFRQETRLITNSAKKRSKQLLHHPETNAPNGGEIAQAAVVLHECLAVAITAKMTTATRLYGLRYAPPFSRITDALNVAGNVKNNGKFRGTASPNIKAEPERSLYSLNSTSLQQMATAADLFQCNWALPNWSHWISQRAF